MITLSVSVSPTQLHHLLLFSKLPKLGLRNPTMMSPPTAGVASLAGARFDKYNAGVSKNRRLHEVRLSMADFKI